MEIRTQSLWVWSDIEHLDLRLDSGPLMLMHAFRTMLLERQKSE